MKRKRWICIAGFVLASLAAILIGCGPTVNQIAAEKAFYEAKIALSKQASSQPVFEMTSGDPSKPIVLENVSAIRVFQLPAQAGRDELRQYDQKDYAQKWVQLIGTTVGVAAPWLGAWGIVHEVSKIAGATTTYNQTVSGMGNTATTRTSSIATGNIGDGNGLTGMSEMHDSGNTTTTTTTTTSTDDHSTTTDDHSTPVEP